MTIDILWIIGIVVLIFLLAAVPAALVDRGHLGSKRSVRDYLEEIRHLRPPLP